MSLVHRFVLIWLVCACAGPDEDLVRTHSPIDSDLIRSIEFQLPDSTDSEGRRLAKLHCQSCHVFVEPDLLDRKTLRESALPMLAKILGLPQELAGLPPKKQDRSVETPGIYPTEALIPIEVWPSIVFTLTGVSISIVSKPKSLRSN